MGSKTGPQKKEEKERAMTPKEVSPELRHNGDKGENMLIGPARACAGPRRKKGKQKTGALGHRILFQEIDD